MKSAIKTVLTTLLLSFANSVWAASGDVLFSDDFESGLGKWTVAGSTAGISTDTANSPTRSLFTSAGVVSVATNAGLINAAVSEARLDIWIRRGSGAFSERPDNNENLVLEYMNSSSSWIALETFSGNGSAGEIFTRSYALPAAALHSNLRLRVRQTAGSGAGFDFWHIDDVRVVETGITSAVADWHFDESSWNGTANEVRDSSGNAYHGRAVNSSPTTGILCNAANLSATSTTDYLNLDYRAVNGLSDFTVSVWVRTGLNRSYMTLLSGARGASPNDNEMVMIFDGASRLQPIVSQQYFADSPSQTISAINSNTWRHLVWTRSAASLTSCIYLDGSLQGCITHPNADDANPLSIASGGLVIGQDQDLVGGGFEASQGWEGYVDELAIFNQVMSLTQIQAVRTNYLSGKNWDGTARTCSAVDHFAVIHDGSAVNCQAEPITLRAHQADHSLATGFTGTVTLSTSTGRGDWSLNSGSGILNNGALNDGIATYAFVAADNGQVQLSLRDTTPETLSINVVYGSITETSGAATASEDPPLTFATSGFQFLGGGVANNLGTQIADKSSTIAAPIAYSLEVQAIRTSDSTGACEAALVGNVPIELAFECRNPSVCGSRQVAINGANINGNNSGSVTAYTTVMLDFGDSSDSTAYFSFLYPDVGRMRLHARYNLPISSAGLPTGIYMQGASNEFVVRPFGFVMSAAGNPAANSATGTRYVRAGQNFTTTVSAVGWQIADDTPPRDGIPDGHNDNNPGNNVNLADNTVLPSFGREAVPETVVLSSILQLPAGGVDPGLAGTTTVSGFVNGSASSTLRFDEVGIIEIAAGSDGNYLDIGAATSALMISRSGYVGRFYPARFNLSANLPDFMASCSDGNFNYLDQPFSYLLAPQLTLTARNAFNGDTTMNYGGSGANRFWKFSPNLSTRSFSNGAASLATLSSTVQGTETLTGDTDFDGQGQISLQAGSGGDVFTYQRTAVEAPFAAAVNLQFPAAALTDSDGVCYDSDNDGSCDSFSINGITGTELRFGRLSMQNAHGPETVNLNIPLRLEYYNGSSFVLNGNENGSCTSLGTADFTYSGTSSALPDSSSLFSGGNASLNYSCSLATPCALGYVDNAANLAASYPWLRYDWGSGSFSDNPRARATFGIYDGSQPQIYLREVY